MTATSPFTRPQICFASVQVALFISVSGVLKIYDLISKVVSILYLLQTTFLKIVSRES